jgi:hypothetical protein
LYLAPPFPSSPSFPADPSSRPGLRKRKLIDAAARQQQQQQPRRALSPPPPLPGSAKGGGSSEGAAPCPRDKILPERPLMSGREREGAGGGQRGAGFRGKGSGQEAGRSPPVGLPGVRQLISSNLLPPISPPQREAGAHAHAHASSLHASAGPRTGAPPWETLKSLLPRSSPLVTTQMKPLLPRSSSILTTLHARPVSLIS